MYRLRYRAVIAALVLAAALFCLLGGLFFPQRADFPRIRLGLDLRGGVQLTLGVDTGKAVQSALVSEGQRIRQLAAESNLLVLGPRLGPGSIPELLLPNNGQQKNALLELIRTKAPDIVPGTFSTMPDGTLRLPLAFTPAYQKQTEELAVNQVLKTISNRIDQFGVSEPDIRKQGGNRIQIQLPGLNDVQRAVQLVGQTAQLSFHLVRDDLNTAGLTPPGVMTLPLKEGGLFPLDKTPLLGGDLIVDARPAFTERSELMVSLSFNRRGADIFSVVTGEHKGHRLAIVLDGVIHSAPVIQDKITGGSATITGRFTVAEAQDLAIALRSGSLSAPVHVLEERTVGPALGEASIRGGLIAAILGTLAVVVLMPLRYGKSGFLADGLLGITLLLLMAGMAAMGATLTLPGIAGVVLTIGMAVDANVLIFERIREEIALGLSPRGAIAAGFERANLAITDSNLTTILVAAILYQCGTGPVRGFAVTLTLGIIASMYTAISLCRICFELWMRANNGARLGISGFLHGQGLIDRLGAFPYLRHARQVIAGALILAAAAAVTLSVSGPRFGVDFAGGATAQVKFSSDVTDSAILNALEPLKLEGVHLQSTGPAAWQIRFALPSHIAPQDLSANILNALSDNITSASAQLVSMESVGPKVGEDLRTSALEAIYYAILLITVYISGRFEHRWGTAALMAAILYLAMAGAGWLGLGILWRMALALVLTFALCWKLRLGFAAGAMASLCFDVTVTISLLAILHQELDLNIVAALLTIIGYSLNDTIVVYDRIREMLRRENAEHPRDIATVIQQSLADTMSRTLLTGGTTLASALALYLFGGQVINGFALTMLIGVTAGTLSSLFVAAPLLPFFGNSSELRKAVSPVGYVRPSDCGVV